MFVTSAVRVQTGESLQIGGQPGLYRELKAKLNYIARSYLRKHNKNSSCCVLFHPETCRQINPVSVRDPVSCIFGDFLTTALSLWSPPLSLYYPAQLTMVNSYSSLFVLHFWDRVLFCIPGWPHFEDPLDSSMLELWSYATMPGLFHSFFLAQLKQHFYKKKKKKSAVTDFSI